MSCRSLIFRNVYEYFKIQNVSEFLTNLIFFALFSDCLLGETDADREEGGDEEDPVKEALLGRLEQHGGNVNWMRRGCKVNVIFFRKPLHNQ